MPQAKEKFMHEYDWHTQWGLEMKYQIFSSVWDRVVHVIHFEDKINPFAATPFLYFRNGYKTSNFLSKNMQQNQFVQWVFMNPDVLFMYRDLIPNEEEKVIMESISYGWKRIKYYEEEAKETDSFRPQSRITGIREMQNALEVGLNKIRNRRK